MKYSSTTRVMLLAASALLIASASHAVPVLQVYLEGATYDTTSETWVLAGGDSGTARLWVIGNTSGGTIENVHLAAAYDSAYSPQIVLTPAAAATRFGFDDPSVASAPVTDGIAYTGLPLMDSGKYLSAHGIYGDGTVWQRFDLGDFSLTDSQLADFGAAFPSTFANGSAQINVYDLTVTGDGLPEDFTIHFDVYNHIEGETRSVFAPFSHDGEFNPPDEEFPPVPEPISMLMLGCVGAGMMTASKLRRRK